MTGTLKLRFKLSTSSQARRYRHPHLPAGLGNRAVLVDHLQQFDLAWANGAVGVEIDTQRQLRHSLAPSFAGVGFP